MTMIFIQWFIISLSPNFAVVVAQERRFVLPLMDLGILQLEEKFTAREKRSLQHSKASFLNKLLQSKDSFQKNKGDTDYFIDSLVKTMTNSDPEMLLKLRERIRKFEGDKTDVVHRSCSKSGDIRPLIQFFNVTRIFLGGLEEDENDEDKKKELKCLRGFRAPYNTSIAGIVEESLSAERKLQTGVKRQRGVTLRVDTSDGKVARIERSKDKSKYTLQIEITSRKYQSAKKKNGLEVVQELDNVK